MNLTNSIKRLPVLALCVIALGVSLSVQAQVERPFKWSGHSVIVADMSTAPSGMVSWWIAEESGNGTHVGYYTCQGQGTLNLRTGVSTGSGCLIAANGDRLFWQMRQEPGTPCYTLTINGGTGRFTYATGLWEGWKTVIEQTQAGPLVTQRQITKGTGSLSY